MLELLEQLQQPCYGTLHSKSNVHCVKILLQQTRYQTRHFSGTSKSPLAYFAISHLHAVALPGEQVPNLAAAVSSPSRRGKQQDNVHLSGCLQSAAHPNPPNCSIDGRLLRAVVAERLPQPGGVELPSTEVASVLEDPKLPEAWRAAIDAWVERVDALVESDSKFEDAHNVFQRMGMDGCEPQLNTYTMMVGMFCSNERVDMALKVWKQMKEKGVLPCMHMFSALINGLCFENRLEEACAYFQEMLDKGIRPPGQLFSNLKEALVEGGRISLAQEMALKLDVLRKTPLRG